MFSFHTILNFLLKLFELKIYFQSPLGIGQVLRLILKLILKLKERKLVFHMKLRKTLIFNIA